MEVPVSITRQADYAVRAVIHLARRGPGGRVATGQIARDESIPPTFLAKIVSQLSAAGIVRATRGARGGVMLARPADELNMLEIIEAIDGPVTLNECVSNPEICPQSDDCVVRTVWGEAQAELVARLRRTSIAQLQAQNGEAPA
jgi:Rrf2 family protein